MLQDGAKGKYTSCGENERMGSPDRQNQPRSRRRMMRPLANFFTYRERFSRDNLQNSIIKYYIIIYSEFQELG